MWKTRNCNLQKGFRFLNLLLLFTIMWCSFFDRYVGVATMDMEFLSVDLNPCPISIGNLPPNYFQNIARCKSSTIVSPWQICSQNFVSIYWSSFQFCIEIRFQNYVRQSPSFETFKQNLKTHLFASPDYSPVTELLRYELTVLNCFNCFTMACLNESIIIIIIGLCKSSVLILVSF